eukprot:scaffold12860_cov54-Attheya_sp.AAC.3
MTTPALSWKVVSAVVVVPFIIGLIVSSNLIPATTYTEKEIIEPPASAPKIDMGGPTQRGLKNEAFDKVLGHQDPFANLASIQIHRNGQVDPCGSSAGSNIYEGLKTALQSYNEEVQSFSKYEFESWITKALGSNLLDDDVCESEEKVHYNIDQGLFTYCDMTATHTTIQPDHDSLVPVPVPIDDGGSEILPCHFHTREGLRVSSLQQLVQLTKDAAEVAIQYPEQVCTESNPQDAGEGSEPVCVEKKAELHLYAVPAGRVFMFAPKFVGEVFELKHVKLPGNLPVRLEVMSLKPRVFDVINFFDRSESDAVVNTALKETSESHRIKRSSTGASGYNVNSQRTSENGFDTHSKNAMTIKKRSFEVLGFDEYNDGHSDGLQVLRYNKTTAYIPHLDFIEDPTGKEEHNYDSAGVGSNRFATILLYMTDLSEGDGGETVFTNTWPNQPPEKNIEIDVVRDSLKTIEKLWRCFHAQGRIMAGRDGGSYPNGEPDKDSLHGGCPVLKKEKWAANLWVWNAPRGGFPGSPVNEEVVAQNREKNVAADPTGPQQLHATFSNTGIDPAFATASLNFQDTFWGNLGNDDPPLSVNTYEGHKWNIMVDGKVKRTVVINTEPNQSYEV